MTKLAHMSKNKNQNHKITETSQNKCFNYYKMGNFEQDCRMLDYRLLKKKSTSNAKQDCNDSSRPRSHNQ